MMSPKILGLSLLLLVGICIQHTDSIAVMSVDLGSEWMKIAIVSPGVPMEIVLNKESKRKTPTAVSFRDGDREFSDAAVGMGVKFPDSVFRYMVDLLGKKIDNPIVKLFQLRFPYYKIEADDKRGTIVFKLSDNTQFSPEELISMILAKAKELAEESTGQTIKDAVITVPVFFNQAERRAMMHAADLAGIKVLQLINDNTAVALNYGIFRRKDFNSTIQRIMLYDMGASSTKATIVGYQTIKMKEKGFTEVNPQLTVLGVGFDRTLGGLEMTLRLRDHLGNIFNSQKKAKQDVFQSPRALAKLFKESERVKMVLSANNEHTAQVEGLLEDKDFRSPVKRVDFEDLCSDLFDRVQGPVRDALNAASMTMDDIDQVILVGAGTRVPKVQERLLEVVGKELSKNLNTDESAALGAVYQGAHLSQGFKVKRFAIKDAVIYPIQVDFERELEKSEGQGVKMVSRTLFGYLNPFPQKKVMTFSRHSKDFNFYVNYGDLSFLTDEDKKIFGARNLTQVSLTGVAEALAKHLDDGSDVKGVKAHFRMDDSGLLIIETVESVFEKQVEASDDTDESTLSKLGSTLSKLFGGQTPEIIKTIDLEAGNGTEDNETAQAEVPPKSDNVSSSNVTQKVEAEGVPKNETKTEKMKLTSVKEPIGSSVVVMDLPDITEESTALSREKIRVLNEKERARVAREEAFNTLESFIIETTQKLGQEEYVEASTESERTKISAAMAETSEWLEEQGIETEAKVYRGKLDDLKFLSRELFGRVKEHRDRPDAMAAIVEMLNMSSIFLERAKTLPEEEQYFTTIELDTLEKQLNDTRDWKETKEKEQAGTPLYEAPRLTIRMIAEKLGALDREVKYLINKAKTAKPKPKPKPEEKADKEPDETTETKDDEDKSTDEQSEQIPQPDTDNDGATVDDTVDEDDSISEEQLQKESPEPTSSSSHVGEEPHTEL